MADARTYKVGMSLGPNPYGVLIYYMGIHIRRARGSIVIEALCYKPKGHGFDSRRGHWIFQLI
jgi:hypothetical protein